MREIKFRAWDSYYESMITIPNVLNNYLYYENCNGFHAGYENNLGDWINLEILQYTGLKDCNDKEIYEGDIVKHIRLLDCEIDEIQWIEDRASFYVWNGSKTYKSYRLCCDCILDNEIEIIGNIYENKEKISAIKMQKQRMKHKKTKQTGVNKKRYNN